MYGVRRMCTGTPLYLKPGEKIWYFVNTNLLPTSCTIFYIYYTKLLHVSAIYPGHLQVVTSFGRRVQSIWQLFIDNFAY
jgi:hypothetical protein